jgi:flagellum-specific ATP synthase
VSGLSQARILVDGLSRHVRLGDHVMIETAAGPCRGEVSLVRDRQVTIVPFFRHDAVRIGDRTDLMGRFEIAPDASWKGRIIDPLCEPLDDGGALRRGAAKICVDSDAPTAMSRQTLGRMLRTGVKAIDGFSPICEGQRLGIFAGSGVGKSTLLGMLSRMPGVDTVVTVLVGERGREVREFVEGTLGDARSHTVAVVATSNDTPMLRQQAPKTGLAIAEYFRDRGERVLLIVDSLTRFAHAMRDYALSADELPVARGYPPSVFTAMGKLLERAGPGAQGTGSITAFASILVDGDDHNDPVADSLRGILDGHIVLDRKIAVHGRYPAIDVLASISRLTSRILDPTQLATLNRVRKLIARYEDTRDIRLLGGYQPGTDAILDEALATVPGIYEYLLQGPADPPEPDVFAKLAALLPPAPGQIPRPPLR